MSYYKIINNESVLENFIDWLPDLEDNQVFFLALQTRHKYNPDIRDTMLRRFTATKNNMVAKIKELELRLGAWSVKGVPLSLDDLVLYINPNPRCMLKANVGMGQHCWKLKDSSKFNLESEALSFIQKSKAYTFVVDFDIDIKEGETYTFIKEGEVDFSFLKKMFPVARSGFDSPYRVLKTRGGYHLLVNPRVADLQIKSFYGDRVIKGFAPLQWHKAIRDMFSPAVDAVGDHFMPVPGGTQGGFIPYFLKV